MNFPMHGDKLICVCDGKWARFGGYTIPQKIRFMLTGKRPTSVVFPTFGQRLTVRSAFHNTVLSDISVQFYEIPGNFALTGNFTEENEYKALTQ